MAPAQDTPPTATEVAPDLRLPGDTRPSAETLSLAIDPTRELFVGTADISITLDRPRRTIWLHGQGLQVARATVASVGGDGRPAEPAVWQQRDDKGTASLTLAKPVAAGRAVIHVEYDAPFTTKLEGLFKVTQTGVPYAFTQFENIAARRAFPCFDEPGFKIPWDVTLEVPSDAKAIANTREIAREESGTSVLVHFATTLPLPSYLVAFAVGPLDVVSAPEIPPNAVRHRALPLRGVTTHGRGKEIAYALAHTGEILAILEQYFGLEYPYDKLDILAVPDMDGAMENAGALTFNDWLLLFDPKTAPSRQTRSYADVMAHELAHQWVGDLVTASWWDDIWLNEAFATWMEGKAADAWDPRTDAATIVLDGIQDAMGSDSLVSARSIRQPVTSVDDIANAFDNITYSKGGAVLGMFERWVGAAAFQRGLHAYLAQHRLGSATADDFLGAESAAAGRDVKTPFHTFLDQPGVPFVEAAVRCDGPARLHLRQTRYLPLGSSGDAGRTWQIPICARYGVGQAVMEACTLLAAAEADLELGARCPDWVFPNSGALGYFRFALAPGDLARLRASGFSRLTAHERVALGNSVRAALGRGALPVGDALDAEVPLASDPHPNVAAEPMGILRQARQWLYRDPLRTAVELYARDSVPGFVSPAGVDARDGRRWGPRRAARARPGLPREDRGRPGDSRGGEAAGGCIHRLPDGRRAPPGSRRRRPRGRRAPRAGPGRGSPAVGRSPRAAHCDRGDGRARQPDRRARVRAAGGAARERPRADVRQESARGGGPRAARGPARRPGDPGRRLAVGEGALGRAPCRRSARQPVLAGLDGRRLLRRGACRRPGELLHAGSTRGGRRRPAGAREDSRVGPPLRREAPGRGAQRTGLLRERRLTAHRAKIVAMGGNL